MSLVGEFRIILQEEGFPSISYELLQEHSDVKLVIYAETEGKIVPFTLSSTDRPVTVDCILCKGKKFKWVVMQLNQGDLVSFALLKVRRTCSIELVDKKEWVDKDSLSRYDYNEFGDSIIRCLPIGIEPKVFR